MVFMHGDWDDLLSPETQKPYFSALQAFVRSERERYEVYPPEELVYDAFRRTSFLQTKVVILGQDPYHGEGQAHGLAFSVQPGMAHPPSLRNIMKELHDDLGIPIPQSGSLIPWAEQGVLLLNTTLTVRAHEAGSHHGHGWETFTDHVISAINEKTERCVFLLWGASAQRKKGLLTRTHHVIIESAHPSPLSAHRGFFGSKPFSQANHALQEAGRSTVDWTLE